MTSPRRPSGAPTRRDGLGSPALQGVVLGTLALHGLLIWGLMQVDSVRELVTDTAPIFVSVFDVPAPVDRPLAIPLPSKLPPTVQSPPTVPRLAQPRPSRPSLPIPSEPLMTASPSPAPEAPQVPMPEVSGPRPTAVAQAQASVLAAPALTTSTAPAAALVPPPAPATAATAAAPRQIPASAVRYLEPPAPVYPRQSIRMNESGTVSLRVFIDEAGLPRTVQITRSSGAPRLDESALAAVQKARFHPPTENGQPISGWARIDIPFELER